MKENNLLSLRSSGQRPARRGAGAGGLWEARGLPALRAAVQGRPLGLAVAPSCLSPRWEPAGSSRFGGLGGKLGYLWDTQLGIEISVSPAAEDLETVGVSEQTQGRRVCGRTWRGGQSESGSTEVPQGWEAASSTLLLIPSLWSGRGTGVCVGGGGGRACIEAPASEGSTVRAWHTSLQGSQDATFCGFPLSSQAGLPGCRAFSSAQSLISFLTITLAALHTLPSPLNASTPGSQALPTECVWRGEGGGGGVKGLGQCPPTASLLPLPLTLWSKREKGPELVAAGRTLGS